MSQFIYLLNAMEHASSFRNPSDHGYAEKRQAVLDYVARLESPEATAWQDCTRCGAAILNKHPGSEPQSSST